MLREDVLVEVFRVWEGLTAKHAVQGRVALGLDHVLLLRGSERDSSGPLY